MARAVRGVALTLALLGASSSWIPHNPVRRPPSAPRAATTAVSAATTDVELGTWMLLVPELNAMPGRFDFDQTEFMSAEELLERVDGLAEAAVLSTCDRYVVVAAATRDVDGVLAAIEARVTMEIAVRAGRTGRQLLLAAGADGAAPYAPRAPLPAVEELPGGAVDALAAAFAGLRDERRGGGDLVADLLGDERAGKREQVRAPAAAPAPTRRDATDELTAAQREKLAIRAAKREARERARLEAKAATFLPLAKTTTREATEQFMLRLGAGLESTIVGDLTIGRQLWDLREACLETGAIATNGPLCALVDAARAAGRRTRDERLGDLSIARFPSREDRMTDDEKRAVLDHARMVVADEHASLKAERKVRRAAGAISELRRRSDERVRRAADAGADGRRARAAANAVLHAPTIALRGDPPDAAAVADAALAAVDAALARVLAGDAVVTTRTRRTEVVGR